MSEGITVAVLVADPHRAGPGQRCFKKSPVSAAARGAVRVAFDTWVATGQRSALRSPGLRVFSCAASQA